VPALHHSDALAMDSRRGPEGLLRTGPECSGRGPRATRRLPIYRCSGHFIARHVGSASLNNEVQSRDPSQLIGDSLGITRRRADTTIATIDTQPRQTITIISSCSATRTEANIHASPTRTVRIADELRATPTSRHAEYSVPSLGLIFLKFADSASQQWKWPWRVEHRAGGEIARPTTAEGVLYLP